MINICDGSSPILFTYHSRPRPIFDSSKHLNLFNCEGKIHGLTQLDKCISIYSFEASRRATTVLKIGCKWWTNSSNNTENILEVL